MVDQRVLAGPVAFVLAVELRDGDVRLVEHDHEVVGEVVEERVRHLAGRAAVEVSRVVLDPGTHPHLAQHLEVVGGAHPQPLGLEELAVLLEPRQPLLQLGFDPRDRALHALGRRHVVRRGEQHEALELLEDLARERVDRGDALHLVAEELKANGPLLVRRVDLDRVAADPELVAREREVVALVLEVDKAAEDAALLAFLDRDRRSGTAARTHPGRRGRRSPTPTPPR